MKKTHIICKSKILVRSGFANAFFSVSEKGYQNRCFTVFSEKSRKRRQKKIKKSFTREQFKNQALLNIFPNILSDFSIFSSFFSRKKIAWKDFLLTTTSLLIPLINGVRLLLKSLDFHLSTIKYRWDLASCWLRANILPKFGKLT